jgi:hypothetical protein
VQSPDFVPIANQLGLHLFVSLLFVGTKSGDFAAPLDLYNKLFEILDQASKYKTIRLGELPKNPPEPARANRRSNCAKLLVAGIVVCLDYSK